MERVIAFSSITYAMKGATLLRKNGISSQTVRVDPKMTKRGCGYGLSISPAQRERAIQLLRHAEIPFSEPRSENH